MEQNAPEDHEQAPPDGEWLTVSLSATDLPEKEKASLGALILDARAVPCMLREDAAGLHLLVPAVRHEQAEQELRLFEQENLNWPPSAPADPQLSRNTVTTISVLLLLATFHNLTLLHDGLPVRLPQDWVAPGSAHAGKIMAGEWWRAVTSLTLHADWFHLAGNLSIGGICIVWVCRYLGSGLGWLLLLLSGTSGNLLNALLVPHDHRSIGASTLVFGAVGILGALSLIRRRLTSRRRWMTPLAASLALLALLGSEGVRTDLGAHLAGLTNGVLLGYVCGRLVEKYGRPDRKADALLGIIGASLVVAAWSAAIGNAGGGF